MADGKVLLVHDIPRALAGKSVLVLWEGEAS